jgi:hypothetical protein
MCLISIQKTDAWLDTAQAHQQHHVHTSRSPPTPAPPPPTLTPPGGSPATGGHPILSRYQIPSLPLVWSPRTAPPRWPWWVGRPLTSLDPTIPWTPPSPPNLGSHRVLQLGVSSWILYVWPFSGFHISSVSQMWFLSNTHYVVLLRLENTSLHLNARFSYHSA